MPPLPVLTAKQLLKILKRHGFEQARQRGTSHVIMQHPDGRWVSVPVHAGKDIKRGTLKGILDRAELTADDLTS